MLPILEGVFRKRLDGADLKMQPQRLRAGMIGARLRRMTRL